MNTAVVMTSPNAVAHAMTAVEMKAQVQRIQQVMRAVMKDKVHYGVVPGTPKPSLWKAGAEVLCATFRIADSYRVEDLSDDRRIRYRVTCVGTHQTTGIVLGEGLGTASSDEEKYQWRDAVCEEEFDEADEDQRRVKWQKGYNNGPPFKRLQIRTDPANAENTVLKMACKRAKIAMTLNVTAASDIFTQDLEDLPEGTETGEEGHEPRQQQTRGKPSTQAPRSRSNGNGNGGSGRCTDKQAKLIGVRLDSAGIPENEFLRRFGIKAIADLPFAKVNDALAWIQNPDDGGADAEDDVGDGRAANGYPD